jgi:type IV secretion system protein VirD4
MTRRATSIAAILLLWLVAGLLVASFAAGALFQIANRQVPHDVTVDSWWRAWESNADSPSDRRKLQFAAGAALVAVFLLPGLVWAKAANARRPTHGDARFARADEIRTAGLLTDERGIIVGRDRGRYLVYGGQQFVLLAAPTRSGKGVGVVIPNLLNYPDSVVVLDIKLENFQLTSGFRAEHDQAVYLFSPFAEDGRSHRWNPFDGVSRDQAQRVGDLLAIAQTLYPSEGKDAFWNEQARNLFLGIALYLFETPKLTCSFGEMLRQGSGQGQPVKTHLQSILQARATGADALSTICRDAIGRFVSTSDNTLAGILATYNAPLTIFANPIVDAATAASDFDLRDVRRRRMSIYVGIQPNRLADAALLVNLFFSQLVHLNTRTLPEQDPTLRYQCLLVLDEFAALGKVGILAKSVAYIAGYNLRLLPIVQSIAQLKSVYGDHDARTFVTNHALQIVFAPREQSDANEYSEMLGYYTETSRSRTLTRPNGFSGPGSRSENTAEQRRALMLPQELKALGQDRQIVFLENCRPILCEKNRYYDDPILKARLRPAVVIAPIDVAMAQARAEGRTRPLRDDEPIQIDRLELRLPLPPLDDQQNPSDASLEAVVAAFMDQLHFVPTTADGAEEQSAGQSPNGEPPKGQRSVQQTVAILQDDPDAPGEDREAA